MDIIEILKQDYREFPRNQTYSIYTENVYFKDPLNQFKGLKRFKQMIAFMTIWFKDIKMDLHDISFNDGIIYSEWTLNLTSRLPWQPRIVIPGKSELKLNNDNLITSHLDYWHISPLNVLKQHFSG